MTKTFSAKLVMMFVFIIAMIKALSVSVYAADYPVASFYAGPFPEDYHPSYVNGTANVSFDVPYGTIFFLIRTPTGVKTLYVSINSYLLCHKYLNDAMSIQQKNFDNSVVVDGVTWYYDYEDAPADVVYHDFIPLPYQYDISAAVRNVAVGITRYYKMLGGELGGSTNLATVEQYLQTIDNNIGSSKIDISDIKTDVNYIRQNGGSSGSGITQDIKDLMVRYDTWLTLIFFAVGLSLFRVVLRSVGDKFSRMR